jgi:hypothetical protein
MFLVFKPTFAVAMFHVPALMCSWNAWWENYGMEGDCVCCSGGERVKRKKRQRSSEKEGKE